MDDFWDNMFELHLRSAKRDVVVSLFATGAPNAVDEAAEMVTEKIKAFSRAGIPSAA